MSTPRFSTRVAAFALVSVLCSSAAMAAGPRLSWTVCSTDPQETTVFRVERVAGTPYAAVRECATKDTLEADCVTRAIVNLKMVRKSKQLEELKSLGLATADGALAIGGVALVIFGGVGYGTALFEGTTSLATTLGLGTLGRIALYGTMGFGGYEIVKNLGNVVGYAVGKGLKALDPRPAAEEARELGAVLPHGKKDDANGCTSYADHLAFPAGALHSPYFAASSEREPSQDDQASIKSDATATATAAASSPAADHGSRAQLN